MDLLTLSLMLFAGLLHASWHSLVKAGADPTINLAGMGIVAGVIASATLPFLPAPPLAVWPVLAASVVLHGSYKVFLGWAYRLGDLAQAFPLARGAAPLFATLIAFGALRQVPSTPQIIGIGFVSAGIFFLMFETLRGPINARLLAATAGAGVAVASYTVLDAYGTRVYGNWAGFTAWLIVIDNLAFLTFSRTIKGEVLWKALVLMKGRIITSGLLGLGSFSVALWALSRNPVGPVSAVRETSVLFAILIGSLIYHERLSFGRVAGGMLVLAGVVAIAMGR
jgi:drug/metabolite transporter (DMT)-like permease